MAPCGSALVALFLVLLTARPALEAQAPPQGPGIAERLPPGTFLVARARDVSRLRAWCAAGPFGALVADPKVRPTWEALKQGIQGLAAAWKEKLGADPLVLLDGLRGEVTFAVTRLQLNPGSRPPVTVGFLLAVEVDPEKREAWRQALESLLDRLPATAVERTRRTFLDGEATVLRARPRAGRPWRGLAALGTLFLSWHGQSLFLTNDRSALERVVRALGGEEGKTLGDTLNWQETTGQLQGAGDLLLFVNLTGLTQLLDAAAAPLPDEAAALIAALGLEEFPALGSAWHLRPREWRATSVLRYSGDGKTGLGAFLAFRDGPLAVPAWVPKEAQSVVVVHYDLLRAFDGLTALVGAAGEEALAGFQEGLDAFEMQTGVSLDRELLPAVAGPIVFVQFRPAWDQVLAAVRAGRSGNRALVAAGRQIVGIGLRRRAPLEKSLALLEDYGAEVTGYGDATVFSFPLADEADQGQYLALTDRYLLLSRGPRSQLTAALEGLRRGGGFARLPAVQRVLADLPRRGAGLVVEDYGRQLAASVNLFRLAGAVLRLQDLAALPVPDRAVWGRYFGYAAGVLTYRPGRGVVLVTRLRFQGRGK